MKRIKCTVVINFYRNGYLYLWGVHQLPGIRPFFRIYYSDSHCGDAV